MMDFEACFKALTERLKDEIIITSAGNTSELWWELTRETERVFYLEASMSLTSMFAAGIAMGHPNRTVVVFSGDGAFCMNTGMLFVERQLDLPNLKHFVVSNRTYGSTNNLVLPYREHADYAGMAKAAGIARVHDFDNLQDLMGKLDSIVKEPGHTFSVLNVEPLPRHAQSPPLDGPEVKFRFGRHLERLDGTRIFDTQLPQ